MSQITRCPFCGTRFRVVADQLRVSDGWVRCGRCHEIFDAASQLLTAQPPPPQAPTASQRDVGAANPPVGAPAPEGLLPGAAAPALAQAPSAPRDEGGVPAFLLRTEAKPHQAPPQAASPPGAAVSAAMSEASHVPAQRVQEEQEEQEGYELPFAELRDSGWPEELEGGDAALEVQPAGSGTGKQHALGDAPPPETAARRHAAPTSEATPQVEAAALFDASAEELLVPAQTLPPPHLEEAWPAAKERPADHEPGFVRAARRKAFWRRPWVRAVLALLSLVLLGTLALQIIVQQRDTIAATAPAARPLLQGLCAALDCSVAPLRSITDVVIESSSFIKGRGDSYRLAVTLQNRAAHPLAMPALELTVTDAQDQPVARRVLLPQDLGAPAELPAHGEWQTSVTVVVTTGGARVVGYRLLAFYP
ncbi:DUF3426 domain-containing protein [Extensimonas vulgaris]|nr:DUF3426 domain-containing protein [Extensimonas vulgaris]